jgi:rubrerythrin
VRIDPEFKKLIPPLVPDEKDRLRANLKRDGCRDALVVWEEEDILLDGHNRLEICEEEGIEYRTATISLPDRAAAEIWILENQAGRRNLSISQKAILALELEERYGDKKKANLRLSQGPGIKGVRESRTPLDVGKKSRDEAAEKFGIKGYAVGFAKTVQSRGVPELFDAVKSGSATITAADKVSRLSPEVQRSVVKGGPELVKKTSTVIHDLTNAEKITPGITEKAVSKIVLGEATTPKEAVEKAASAEELKKLREFNEWAVPKAREAGRKVSAILDGKCEMPNVREWWCESCRWGFDTYVPEPREVSCPYCGGKNLSKRDKLWLPESEKREF